MADGETTLFWLTFIVVMGLLQSNLLAPYKTVFLPHKSHSFGPVLPASQVRVQHTSAPSESCLRPGGVETCSFIWSSFRHKGEECLEPLAGWAQSASRLRGGAGRGGRHPVKPEASQPASDGQHMSALPQPVSPSLPCLSPTI